MSTFWNPGQRKLNRKDGIQLLKFWGLVIATVAMTLVAANASAQEATNASAILAEAAKPTTVIMEEAVKCAALDKDNKKWLKFCADLAKLEVARSTKAANETADSLKHSRPIVVGGSPFGNPFAFDNGANFGNSGFVGTGGARVTSCGDGGCNTVSASGVNFASEMRVTQPGANRKW